MLGKNFLASKRVGESAWQDLPFVVCVLKRVGKSAWQKCTSVALLLHFGVWTWRFREFLRIFADSKNLGGFGGWGLGPPRA